MSGTLVLPGDLIPLPASTVLTLGPGISASSSRVTLDAPPLTSSIYIATRAGLLGSSKGKDKGQQSWVEGSSKRVYLLPQYARVMLILRQYIAAQKELVLGTIIARHADGYRVDLGTAQMATLDALAFEGATKRNLKVRRETPSPHIWSA